VLLEFFTSHRELARMLLHAASAVSHCHYNGALERVEVFANKVINSDFFCYFDAISMLELWEAVNNLRPLVPKDSLFRWRNLICTSHATVPWISARASLARRNLSLPEPWEHFTFIKKPLFQVGEYAIGIRQEHW